MSANDPAAAPTFHAGEVMLQETAGLAERIAVLGERAIRRHMPTQHREFFSQLPYLVVGALDARGQPWASILCGSPGFVRSPDEFTLCISAQPAADDPLAGAFRSGAPVGLLGFDAQTRRRNRANGLVTASDARDFTVRIQQSFGNCPKYIQTRQVNPAPLTGLRNVQHLADLNDKAHRLVANADTFFIASAHPDANDRSGFGVDVSHRGGKPGFVKIERGDQGETRLLVPDFAGNFFFNTFGNIALNPRAGLLFIDYAAHGMLHIAGHAELILEGPAIKAYAGVQRLLSITVDSVIQRSNALPLAWSAAKISPFLEGTGNW